MCFCWLVESNLKESCRSHLISQDMLFQFPQSSADVHYCKNHHFAGNSSTTPRRDGAWTDFYTPTSLFLFSFFFLFFPHECTMTCTVSRLTRHCSVEDSGSAHRLTLITTGCCFVLYRTLSLLWESKRNALHINTRGINWCLPT